MFQLPLVSREPNFDLSYLIGYGSKVEEGLWKIPVEERTFSDLITIINDERSVSDNTFIQGIDDEDNDISVPYEWRGDIILTDIPRYYEDTVISTQDLNFYIKQSDYHWFVLSEKEVSWKN